MGYSIEQSKTESIKLGHSLKHSNNGQTHSKAASYLNTPRIAVPDPGNTIAVDRYALALDDLNHGVAPTCRVNDSVPK
jgi:hypothetical protein